MHNSYVLVSSSLYPLLAFVRLPSTGVGPPAVRRWILQISPGANSRPSDPRTNGRRRRLMTARWLQGRRGGGPFDLLLASNSMYRFPESSTPFSSLTRTPASFQLAVEF
ncbi:Hypothetical protein NTJ_03324 [Nesidiocoris tenuis]|uniref:Secreted protein n=1 Tax=Nesidiocoris tenuis TaxID=355587 RepID=A0ABN7AE04_9HEMI|nr:Hypothetical protein NTJ_03324 [Nesidiocoris tenuis]